MPQITPKLIELPERNQFPAAKWKQYIRALETLNRLLTLRKRIFNDLRIVESEVVRLRRELVDAVARNGAGIENGGRIAAAAVSSGLSLELMDHLLHVLNSGGWG